MLYKSVDVKALESIQKTREGEKLKSESEFHLVRCKIYIYLRKFTVSVTELKL